MTGSTGIVVAHRASTVLLADRVALLENGTVTEVGAHADLLARVPHYRYLLAADDELDDGSERTGGWLADEERELLDRAHRERQAAEAAEAVETGGVTDGFTGFQARR